MGSVFRRAASLALAASLAVGSSAAASPQEIERRVDDLLARMTLEEKFGQLQQLDGPMEGAPRSEHLELARRGLLGSTLNVRGAKNVDSLQRAAVEESRLKIPILFAFDVIHGYRTVFPVPLAEASSWDPELAERAAQVAAREASAAGLKWTFAPMLDIARDPRWGRVVEGSGEDPFLGSAMAAARVRGFQGDDPSAPERVAACAKHWVAYGAAEAGRDYNGADVSERTLREIHFPPFRAALRAGALTVMSAFNDLNGVPASANPWTLTDVLRGEWKFDGLVVSDYTSVRELLEHGSAASEADAARAALTAGVDMEMVSRLYGAHGPRLVREGSLPVRAVDEAVRRVLRVKLRLGLFERPYADERREARELLAPAHVGAARLAAGKSLVLLRNEGRVLPFSKALKRLAVIGPLADDPAPIGPWSGDGRKEDVVTLLAGLRAKATAAEIVHVKGCEVDGDAPPDLMGAARAAFDADAVVLALGESAELSGEAASRSSIGLPGRQLELAKAVLAAGKPTAVVLMNGRPLALAWLAGHAPAILEAWFGGSQAGHAVADALFGDVNPGGKLPITFPRDVGQIPIYYNHRRTGRPPGPDKYTSKYLDVDVTPQFPFGFGLSYSSFALEDLRVSSKAVSPGGRLTVGVDVRNTSSVAGDEVIQLYLRGAPGPATRPVRELKGFARVTLGPGERRRVEFGLGPDELSTLDGNLRPSVPAGRYVVFVGTDSTGGLEAAFDVR